MFVRNRYFYPVFICENCGTFTGVFIHDAADVGDFDGVADNKRPCQDNHKACTIVRQRTLNCKTGAKSHGSKCSDKRGDSDTKFADGNNEGKTEDDTLDCGGDKL